MKFSRHISPEQTPSKEDDKHSIDKQQRRRMSMKSLFVSEELVFLVIAAARKGLNYPLKLSKFPAAKHFCFKAKSEAIKGLARLTIEISGLCKENS